MEPWRIVEEVGLASTFHRDPMRNIAQRTCSFVRITRNALVLGSSQNRESVSEETLRELDAELVTRRSGGGAVYLEMDGQLWIEISVPRRDPLFRNDLAESFIPIGEMFVSLLREFALPDISIHLGRLEVSDAASAICFAGLGPGEVTFEGAKIVGIAQRRTALGSVFQCTLYARFPHKLVERLMGPALAGIPAPGYAFGLGELVTDYVDVANGGIVADLQRRFENLLSSAPPAS